MADLLILGKPLGRHISLPCARPLLLLPLLAAAGPPAALPLPAHLSRPLACAGFSSIDGTGTFSFCQAYPRPPPTASPPISAETSRPPSSVGPGRMGSASPRPRLRSSAYGRER